MNKRYWILICCVCAVIGFYFGVETGSKKTAEKLHILDRAFDGAESMSALRYLHQGAIDTAMLHHDYILYDIAKELSNLKTKDTAIINFIETINNARRKYGSKLDTTVRYPLEIEIKK